MGEAGESPEEGTLSGSGESILRREGLSDPSSGEEWVEAGEAIAAAWEDVDQCHLPDIEVCFARAHELAPDDPAVPTQWASTLDDLVIQLDLWPEATHEEFHLMRSLLRKASQRRAQAVELSPENIELRRDYACQLFDLVYFSPEPFLIDLAIQQLERVLEIQPDDQDAKRLLVSGYLYRGQAQDEEAWFDEALAMMEDAPEDTATPNAAKRDRLIVHKAAAALDQPEWGRRLWERLVERITEAEVPVDDLSLDLHKYPLEASWSLIERHQGEYSPADVLFGTPACVFTNHTGDGEHEKTTAEVHVVAASTHLHILGPEALIRCLDHEYGHIRAKEDAEPLVHAWRLNRDPAMAAREEFLADYYAAEPPYHEDHARYFLEDLHHEIGLLEENGLPQDAGSGLFLRWVRRAAAILAHGGGVEEAGIREALDRLMALEAETLQGGLAGKVDRLLLRETWEDQERLRELVPEYEVDGQTHSLLYGGPDA